MHIFKNVFYQWLIVFFLPYRRHYSHIRAPTLKTDELWYFQVSLAVFSSLLIFEIQRNRSLLFVKMDNVCLASRITQQNRGHMPWQAWHFKIPACLKAVVAKQYHNFKALRQEMKNLYNSKKFCNGLWNKHSSKNKHVFFVLYTVNS